jgi:two-component system sensor histidine kinase TtrS
MWRLLLASLLVAGMSESVWCDVPTHAIGVLVRDDGGDAYERWTPTADFLAARIPGHAFVVVPLRQEALSRAVARGEIEFAVTHPGHYVELAVRYGIAAIATMQRFAGKSVKSTAGTAIIARADRHDISWMSDLRGKSFMAVSPDSFVGFQLARWELGAHDIDPFRDFSRLVFSGTPAERIVEAVRDGAIDGAAVRTDVLENMVAEGAIALDALRVLHPRATAEHPVPRSTDLYPGWAFAAAQAMPGDLAQRVAQALRAMPVAGFAARAAGYAGWAAPLDYRPVQEVLRDLQVSPYENVAEMTLVQLAQRHRNWVIVACAFVLLTAGTLVYVVRLNYRLRMSRRELERARAAEVRMAHLGRLAAMGEMSTTLAHELNQPLAAIVNYANGSIRRLHSGALDRDDLMKVLERIASEGNRSAEIIRRVREFLRKRKPLQAPEDANRIVREAVDLVHPAARQRNVDVRLALAKELPHVVVDAVQIEQVVVNLVHNAVEAIDDANSARREVVVATAPNAQHGVDVTVCDTGPGIPVGVADRLFEPFVSTKREGMGLGLSISRSIIEAHGDHLRVVARDGVGAAFRFTLPQTESTS